MKQKKGMFVTFEGVDGSGKTTVIEWLRAAAEKQNILPCITKEPGGSVSCGREIKSLLLQMQLARNFEKNDKKILAEFLVFFAERILHLQEKIIPALSEGKLVISDRFFDSSFVYQIRYGGLPKRVLEMVHQWGIEHRVPDITFYCNASLATILDRLSQRNEIERGNKVQEEFISDIHKLYETYFATVRNKRKIIYINTDEPQEKIMKKIARYVF